MFIPEKKRLFATWKKKYGKLKDFVKGSVAEEDINYKVFFLDLLTKTSSKSHDDDSDTQPNDENKEENNNNE